MAPLIVLEFASGDGSEERDRTPLTGKHRDGSVKPGKFWVYERIMRIPYYGIYEMGNDSLEVYHLVHGCYQAMPANERGHYLIEPMGVELGLWQGSYQNQEQLWLRWWDDQGKLLLIGDERARLEQQRAEQAEAQLAQERQQVEQTRREAIAKLIHLGLSPEQIADSLSVSVAEVQSLVG
jgi:hypothetical protein